MENVIDMQGVSYRRNKKPILSEINWQVNKGEHWAIIGLNGAGKTTLLNMVNGYIWPTTGQVSVLGQQFGKTAVTELRKSIGWVSSSLKEKMKMRDIAENVVISGKYASIGLYETPVEQDYEKASLLMEQLGCSHLSGQIYETCSQGEKQRLLIARGLMASPKLLILDEPANGLDFIAKEELLASIGDLAKQVNAPTILLVTHHIEEVLPIFTHALLIRDGTVFAKGKRKDLLDSASLSSFFNKNVQINWNINRAWLSLASS